MDNDTFSRLMANPAAMDALMKIEGFRSLNEDKLTSKEKNELSEEEKEYKSKRKQIQEN